LVVRDLWVVAEGWPAWVEVESLQVVKRALVVRDLRVVVDECSAWVGVELEPLKVVKALVVRDLWVMVAGCSAWVEVVVAAEVEAGLSLLVLSLRVLSPTFELSEAEVEVAVAANLNP
jgi:hypothetical protein